MSIYFRLILYGFGHVEIISKPFRDYCGNLLEPFLHHLDIFWGAFWNHVGIRLDNFGTMLEPFWDNFGTCWENL